MHHYSDYAWVAVVIVGLAVRLFNGWRMGKFPSKKELAAWVALGVIVIAALLILPLSGCSSQAETPEVVETVTTELAVYEEMSDGTWQWEGRTYQHRLEISGRMHNAAADSTFVYLSNLEEITFDQAWKAAGFSSSTADYFSPEEAVLVDWFHHTAEGGTP